MSKCSVAKDSLLPKEVINQVKSSHKDLFIEGLTSVQQKEVTKFISAKLYDETVKGTQEFTTDDLTKELTTQINFKLSTKRGDLNHSITHPTTDSNYEATIEALSESIRLLETVKNTIPTLVQKSINELRQLKDSTVENITANTSDDLISATESSSEVDRDRTDYGDNYSLEIDAKKNAPGKLKEFLSFVKRKRFNPMGKVIGLRTFFNTDSYYEYGQIYDELHRILEGVYPSQKAVFERLREFRDKAIQNKQNSLAWLGEFIEVLEAEANKPNSDVLKLFIRDMVKHHVNMEYIYYVKVVPDPNSGGSYRSYLTVGNDNSTTAYRRLLGLWKSNFNTAPIVDRGTTAYDEEYRLDLLAKVEEAIKFRGERETAFTDFFEAFDIEVSPEFIKALADDKVSIRAGKSYLRNSTKVLQQMKLVLAKMGPTAATPVVLAEFSALQESFMKGLAKEAIKYSDREYSNTMRVGDKLIQSYTANHNLALRLEELKQNGMGGLKQVAFSRHSIYGNLIEDRDKEFIDAFGMSYVSLYPLLVKDEARPFEGTTKLSDLDSEVLHVGFALRNTGVLIHEQTFTLSNGKTVTLNVQEGSYVAPTMSDKTRVFTINGYTYRVSKSYEYTNQKGEKKSSLTIQDKAINLYMDGVVLGEMERIALSADSDYVDSLNLRSYRGDLFYLTPYLNNVYINTQTGDESVETDENAVLLTDFIKSGIPKGTIEGNVMSLIKSKVKEDLISKAKSRYLKWKNLGLIEDGVFKKATEYTSYSENIYGEVKADEVMGAYELAIDMTFSEEISNANFLQLVSSDPAQFYKKGTKQASVIEQNNADVKATNGVVTKRLAAESAPGDSADTTGEEEYLEIFLEDIYTESSNVDDIVEILDGKEARKKLEALREDPTDIEGVELKAYIKTLIAEPYFNIETTNAQEYITWKSHIKEMLRYGEITKDEYTEIYNTLNTGGVLSKELTKKVVGPRKPLHSSTVVQKLDAGGENKLFRKTYIKTSTVVLLPQMITEDTKLYPLRKAMEDLEKKEGKSVRAAYQSGVKVGFPKVGLNLIDKETGEYKKDLELLLGVNTLTLRTDGLRIQQSVPFSEDKDQVSTGSQEKKLLFTNLLELEFSFEGNKLTGRDLKLIYDDVYKEISDEGLREFNEYITTDGKLNYRKLARILKAELKARGETAKPLYDGLTLNKKGTGFKTPLWKSAYSDQYMARLNSIVKKKVLQKKKTGTSSVLVSEAGFIAWEDWGEQKAQEEGVVFSPGYDPKEGLQGIRFDSKGNILPAQIMLPFKFRNNEGELLDVKDFMEPGTNLIDLSKLPKELLESSSFRIPTQLQQSMSYVEIVGFLPYSMGDTVIATKDFIIQMGSDFDVDKLYSYLFNTEYSEGKLSKLKHITKQEVEVTILALEQELEEFLDASIPNKEVKDYLKERVNVIMATVNTEGLTKKEIKTLRSEKLAELLKEEDYEEQREFLYESKVETKTLEISSQIDELRDMYSKSLENKLMEIHKVVLLHREAQKFIAKPLGIANYQEHVEAIDKINSSEGYTTPSIISHEYNALKMTNGNSGKDGISIFSSDSVLQSYMEGKKIVAHKYIETEKGTKAIPLTVKFGTAYGISRGELGRNKTLKNNQDKSLTISEYISALQTLSVDNANLEMMGRINLNEDTAGVYSLLHFLGFEDDITSYFMSQPIIVDYIREMSNAYSTHADREYNARGLKQEELMKRYDLTFNPGSPVINTKLADFDDMDAVQHMSDMIKYKDGITDFGPTQVAILNKFLELQTAAHHLNQVKKYLNIDSKGLDKNFYVTERLTSEVTDLPNSPIKGIHQLIGEFERIPKTNMHIFVAPTTLAGYDLENGANTLIDTFGNEFLESNPAYNFKGIVAELAATTGRRSFNDKELYDIRKQYAHYLNSNIKNGASIRKELFYNNEEGSLYQKLKDLKKTEFAKNSKFLSNLSIVKGANGLVIINFERVAGDNYNDDAIYEDFVNLLTEEKLIETANGTVNVSEVMQNLSYYGVLKGAGESKSFYRYIPTPVIDAITIIPTQDNNIGHSVDTYNFIMQYSQNFPVKIPIRKNKEVNVHSDGSITLTAKGTEYLSQTPIVIKYKGKLYARKSRTDNAFVLIPSTRDDNVTTYNYGGKEAEIIEKSGSEELSSNTNTDIDITSLDGMSLGNFYSTYGDLKIENSLAIIRKSIAPLNSSIKIKLSDKITAQAHYDIKTNTIVLNSKEIPFMSNEVITRLVMHEHMHSLTQANLMKMGMGTIPVTDAVKRIQANIFKMIEDYTYSTDFMVKDIKSAAFKTAIYLYYQGFIGTPVIDAMASLATHPLAVQAFSDMSLGITLEDKLANGATDVLSEKEAIEALGSDEQIEMVHALTSIFEYVAIIPSESTALQNLAGRNYPKFINNLLEYLKEVFSSLGIADPGVHRALTDIYDIAGITPISVEEEIEVSSEVHSVFSDAKEYFIQGNEYVDSGGEPVMRDNTMYEVLHRAFIKSFESKIAKGEMDRNINYVETLNDSGSSLFEKLRAYASSEEDVTNFDVILGLTTPVKKQSQDNSPKLSAKEKLIAEAKRRNKGIDLNSKLEFIALGKAAMRECIGSSKSIKAEHGLYIPPMSEEQMNDTWEVVTELDGPSHSKGGIQLAINDGNVTYSHSKNAKFKAEYGMYIPSTDIDSKSL